MTEEEIEKQADEYLLAQEGVCVGGCEYSYHHNNAIKKAFQTGAKWGMETICKKILEEARERHHNSRFGISVYDIKEIIKDLGVDL